MSPFPNLFQPLRVGSVTSRNRIVASAHTKLYGQGGTDSQRTVDYYEERARGGFGILFTDSWLVHPSSSLGLSRRNWVAKLAERPEIERRLVDRIHAHGALAFTQLAHNGAASVGDSADDLRAIWGPSAVRSPASPDIPKEMEPADIQELIAAYADAAEAVRDTGFDGCEVLASHGYLLHEFLSPVYNKRTDSYGGSAGNRARLLREILAAIRDRVGTQWTVGVRMSSTDMIDGGLDVTDACRLTEVLVSDGHIDFVNVSGGEYHDPSQVFAPSDGGDAYFADLAADIRRVSGGLPVFVAGGIRHPEDAERIIAEGQADAVAMARAAIADPEWPVKAETGRQADIVHCIRGNQGCFSRALRGFPVGCTVNPAAGREGRLGTTTLDPAAAPGNWVVVGGGPAGMRAAATLAQRGHRVTLLERAGELGGQVRMILRTPGRAPFRSVIDDLANALERTKVQVEFGVEATVELLRERAADGIVIATGALPGTTGFSTFAPLVPRIPGVESSAVRTVWDVLGHRVPVGRRVVVLDDEGDRYAAGVAEVLLDQGSEVDLITPLPAPFAGTLGTMDMAPVYRRLFGKGLRARPRSWVAAIGDRRVTVIDAFTGAQEVIDDVDNVVLCTARVADDALYRELRDQGLAVHRIGDCVAPRKIDHAIFEGEMAGRELWTPHERAIYDGDLERTAG